MDFLPRIAEEPEDFDDFGKSLIKEFKFVYGIANPLEGPAIPEKALGFIRFLIRKLYKRTC